MELLSENDLKQELLDGIDTDGFSESAGDTKKPAPWLIPQESIKCEIKKDLFNIQDDLEISETMVTKRDTTAPNMTTTAIKQELENRCVENVYPETETGIIMADTRIYMGDLTRWNPPAEEEPYFKRVIQILDQYYPEDWRAWVVNKLSYEDLFGDGISAEDEDRLRFAIPTVDLIQALRDGPVFFTKRIFLSWPLARALIYFPFSIMEKTHPRDAYNEFRKVTANLKPKLISWTHASELLKRTTCRNRKRSHSSSQNETGTKKSKENDTLMHFMVQQRQMLNELLQQQDTMMNEMGIKTTDMDAEPSDGGQMRNAPSGSQEGSENGMIENEDDEQEPLVVPEELFNFLPETKETEPELPTASEELVKEAIKWQRLGQKNWREIPYLHIQKRLEAAPVFTSLKVNSILSTVTPNTSETQLLEKMDLTFAVITHGLLKQRQAFQEYCCQAPPKVKALLTKHLWDKDAKYRLMSDDLLQYVCGVRSDIIEQRRNVYGLSKKY